MPDNRVTLTLIGGPTVLIEYGGLRILTDPTFDEPGSYEARGVTLTKLSGPAVEPDALGSVDVVLLSHDLHADNLDRAGRAFLATAGRVLTTRAGAGRLDAEGLDPWQAVDLPAQGGGRVRITGTPARHGPVGIEPISGDVIGFALTSSDPGPAVYISGDTVWYEGVAEVAERFDVRLAVLFTGSAEPRGAFHMTMDVNDAVAAAHAFPRATIVPVHNDGWAHFKESATDVAQTFAAVGLGARVEVLTHGVAMAFGLGDG